MAWKVFLLPAKRHKLTTNVKRKTLNPRWNEVFVFEGEIKVIIFLSDSQRRDKRSASAGGPPWGLVREGSPPSDRGSSGCHPVKFLELCMQFGDFWCICNPPNVLKIGCMSIK